MPNKMSSLLPLSSLKRSSSVRLIILQGHRLNVYDVVPAACADMKAKGSTVYNTAEEVAQNSDYVITMLPNHDIVFETYSKIAEKSVKPNTFFVDSSTIDPNVAKQVTLSRRTSQVVDALIDGPLLIDTLYRCNSWSRARGRPLSMRR